MRKDMSKVLVTTPRAGSSLKNREVKESRRKEREGDYDNLPSYSSMKPKSRRWDERKSLNEYLNPLIRYLEKSRNKPWDKVYSDISKNLDRRSAVQEHIFLHLFDYVEVNPVFGDNGAVYDSSGSWPLYKTGYTFYVDNKGFLREPKKRRPPWKKKDSISGAITTDDESVFIVRRSSDLVWFEVSFCEWPSELYNFRIHKNPGWINDIFNGTKFAAKRAVLKTLSKKEKKEYLSKGVCFE